MRKLVAQKLETLHKDAKNDHLRIGQGAATSISRPMKPTDFEQAYLPISKEQGETLQQLIIDNHCKHVVEFGTSFGISTIYLADAVRQTGGTVITTELIESKAKKAMQHIEEVGLKEYVEFRIGDAMETLAKHSTPIDFLFLDGWKDLYAPLFQLLEPQFHSRTLIYADNMDMEETQVYADYVLNNDRYSTRFMNDGKAFLTTFTQ